MFNANSYFYTYLGCIPTSTDLRVNAEVAVAPVVQIGNVKLQNVVFLVLADKDLFFEPINYQINGIIGFPVIEAFREISLTKKDELTIPAGSSARNGEQNLCLDELTPLISAVFKDQRMTFAFDTGATTSRLFPAFYKSQQTEIKRSGKLQTVKLGGAGGSSTVTAYRLKNLSLRVSGKGAELNNIEVIPTPVNEDSRYYFGQLGQDLIKQFEKMTINFQTMTLTFER